MSGILGAALLRERLLAHIRREIVRTMRMQSKPPRVGLVQSYDPKKHAVKIQFQPEGTVSNWIPLTAISIGNQFGVMFAPNIKDQVEVHHQEGDHMVARVTTRHFSQNVDQAPEVQAGEYHLIHGSGAVIRFLQDGTLFLGGASTVSTGNVGGGQSGNTTTGNQGTVADPNQQGTQQQPQKPNAKQSMSFNTDGSWTLTTPNGKVTINAQNGEVDITSNTKIVLTAPTIVLNGNVVTGGAS